MELTVVPVVPSTGGTFNFGVVTRLLDTAYFTPTPTRAYDIAPDGQKFLFVKNPAQTALGSTQFDITVVLNWQEELKQRLPAK